MPPKPDRTTPGTPYRMPRQIPTCIKMKLTQTPGRQRSPPSLRIKTFESKSVRVRRARDTASEICSPETQQHPILFIRLQSDLSYDEAKSCFSARGMTVCACAAPWPSNFTNEKAPFFSVERFWPCHILEQLMPQDIVWFLDGSVRSRFETIPFIRTPQAICYHSRWTPCTYLCCMHLATPETRPTANGPLRGKPPLQPCKQDQPREIAGLSRGNVYTNSYNNGPVSWHPAHH